MRSSHKYTSKFTTSTCGVVVRIKMIIQMSSGSGKHPNAFLVQMLGDVDDLRKVANKRNENINFQSSDSWVQVAHSDHNPNKPSGHNIYNSSDSKQLHIDIQDPENPKGDYKDVIKRICNGNPDRPTGKALAYVEQYMKRNCNSILIAHLT